MRGPPPDSQCRFNFEIRQMHPGSGSFLLYVRGHVRGCSGPEIHAPVLVPLHYRSQSESQLVRVFLVSVDPKTTQSEF